MSRQACWKLLALAFLFAHPLTCAAESRFRYHDYLEQTVQGLQRLRGANGLPRDAALVGQDGSLRPSDNVPALTSPSNIGVFLLVQLDLLDRRVYRDEAQQAIDQVLATLSREPVHPSGLFYNWYLTQGFAFAQQDVSSIDNLHLALALWAVAKRLPGTISGHTAAALFARLDFSPFVDKARTLLGGNLHFLGAGQWILENYRYDYFGSETRSLYSLGAALRLRGADRAFFEKALAGLTMELAEPYGAPILRTWDGGTFQLFLPELLIGEANYSRELSAMFHAYADFAWREGERRQLALPAAHSACAVGVAPDSDDPQPDENRVLYQGQEGSRTVGNRQVAQTFDDSTISIHAVLMAATADPLRYLVALDHLVDQLSNTPQPLFRSNLGFLDGVRIRNAVGSTQQHALPVVLALDKGIEALALLQILSSDHATSSARLLAADPTVHAELKSFYSLVDKRLSTTAIGN